MNTMLQKGKKRFDTFLLLLTSPAAKIAFGATQRFHELFTSNDIDKIINELDSHAQAGDENGEFSAFIFEYRKILGGVIKATPIECYVTEGDTESYVNFIFKTKYENEIRGSRFSVRVKENKGLVLGHDIFNAEE